MKFRNAVLLILILEGLMGFSGVGYYGFTVEGLQAVTRFSGRLSLIIFSFIFLLHQNKRINVKVFLSTHYFLVFALAHGIHLIELLGFVYWSGAKLVPHRIAGGFLAYAFIFVMPWLEALFQTGKLTQKVFSILVYAYLYYVWFIFLVTYLTRVLGKVPNAGGTRVEHVTLMVWVLFIFGIKIAESIFLYRKKTDATNL